MNRQEAGFNLLEVVAVVALTAIGSSVAIIQMKNTIAKLDADKAANTVVSEINYARQLAVDQRRNVLVEFVGTNELRVTRQESGGGTTRMDDVTLPTGYSFNFPTGIGDTPDGFLAGSSLYTSIGTAGKAVFVGAGTTGTFIGDGTFVDNSNVLLNGEVFTQGTGNGTARAVTLSGATGKVKQYWLQGSTWVVR